MMQPNLFELMLRKYIYSGLFYKPSIEFWHYNFNECGFIYGFHLLNTILMEMCYGQKAQENVRWSKFYSNWWLWECLFNRIFWKFNHHFGSYTLINSGLLIFFITKYDSNGNVLWAKSAGGISSDKGNSYFYWYFRKHLCGRKFCKCKLLNLILNFNKRKFFV